MPKTKEIVKKITKNYIFLTILFVCCNEKPNFVTIICLLNRAKESKTEKFDLVSILTLTSNFMNKGELVKAVAENAGLTLAQAKAAVDAAINSVSAALKAGDKVTIPGIVTIAVEERAARTGINPQTKEKIQIPAKKVVKFKAGSQLI